MTEHAVVIAGGGPTGMMLEAESALAKVDVVIVERRTSQDLDGSRAGGLHSRHDRGSRSAWQRRGGNDMRTCPTRGSTESVMPQAQPATPVQRATATPEVSR
jgi:2-polyprenyl-6-methoxyphenol hydroxylase-like FAD-dependent oxidoreductase